MPILAKKIIFSDEAHFDLCGYVNKQNCRIWGTENLLAYIEKPTHPNWVTVWCGFCFRGIIEPFFVENEQGKAVIVNGDRYRAMLNEFFSQILKTRTLETFGFNRTKIHSMFYALFFKIALSAAELMSFGYLGAAIWHRWNIICELPSKISVTPISQRQLKLSRTIFVKPLVKYSCT